MLKITKPNLSWNNFYVQCKLDIELWCYFVLLQQIGRLYFICTLRKNISTDANATDIFLAIINGLRFDSVWATCAIFVTLVFFTLPSLFTTTNPELSREKSILKYRRYFGGIFTMLTVIIYIGAVEYFREYKDIFNQFLFGWFYDDKVAILKTIYTQHHVIGNSILLIIILLLYIKISGYFFNKKITVTANPALSSRGEVRGIQENLNSATITKEDKKNGSRGLASSPRDDSIKNYSSIRKILIIIALVLFYIVSFRGSIGRRPVQLKDAGITIDEFLNKAIVSPYSSLKYAIDDHNDLNQELQKDANLSVREMQLIAQKFFNNNNEYPSLADYMEKSASGSSFKKPKHIFIIVGESLDAWHMQAEYKKFNLTPNLDQLIKNGAIYFKYFLPGANGTMETLNTIITGIPDANMHINYQKSAYSVYPTAIALQFKKLGYKAQFFYGGYLSWQRLGDFAKAQGFDEVYGGAHMKQGKQTNEWGVDDKALFDFINTNIEQTNRPTFNVIMTTSNHPPFSINLEEENFHKKTVAKYTNRYVHELGHIWYSDKTIGAFIKKIIAIDNNALIAITGDHYGRRHAMLDPPLFDKSAVPLIIYSTSIKGDIDGSNIAGSHLDLAPTLIEMIAPKGSVYYSFGDSLLNKRAFNLGLGKDRIITEDFIVAISTNEITFFNKNKILEGVIDTLKNRYLQGICIARYIIKKGALLHDKAN